MNLGLLGTILSLNDVTRQEINNRIEAGWKMFWGLKRVLLNDRVSINRRLRLFDSTVGSCVTWCCESWTPRASELRYLESARRSMLRKMVCQRRGPDEEWLQWIVRATHKALDKAEHCSVKNWCTYHYERKWRWALHVARSSHDSWIYRVTTWRDSTWQQFAEEMGTQRELRPSRRRWMKWEDALRRFCTSSGLPPWDELAGDREAWKDLASRFQEWSSHAA